MDNDFFNLASWMPAICACIGVFVGAKYGAKNDNYLLKLLPIKRFLNETHDVLLKKIEDDVRLASISLTEYCQTNQSDAFKRFGLRLQLAEKILDIETSCETMIMKLGFEDETANLLRLKINRKNERLNYFDSPVADIFSIDEIHGNHERKDEEEKSEK